MNKNKVPLRCIDPVMKFCQCCKYGVVVYPPWVETRGDLEGCSFESYCSLGFDKGRPEDEPTEEDIEEFKKQWLKEELYI